MRCSVALILLGRDRKWLQQRTGLAWKTIDHLLAGDTVRPAPRTLARVSRALGVSTAWLTANASQRRLTAAEREELLHRVRGLAALAGGVRTSRRSVDPRAEPRLRRERERRVPQQFRMLRARHVYRVRGEAESPFGFRDRDLVYVRPLHRGNIRSAVGGIVVVEWQGALLLKQLTVGPRGVVILRSAYSGYRPITVGPAEECRPLGQVVASVRYFVEPPG